MRTRGGEDDGGAEGRKWNKERGKVKRRIKLFSCAVMRGETEINSQKEEDEKRTDERWLRERWKRRDDR